MNMNGQWQPSVAINHPPKHLDCGCLNFSQPTLESAPGNTFAKYGKLIMINAFRTSAALFFALTLLPFAAQAQDPAETHVTGVQPRAVAPTPVKVDPLHPLHPFASLAGNWTGGGSIELTGEIKETLRCRASYTLAQTNGLALAIRCASDNYKFELSSNVSEHGGGSFAGRWREATYDVSGAINGRINGNRIVAQAQGDSFNAALSVVTNGNSQSVTITPERTYVISVKIAMNRH